MLKKWTHFASNTSRSRSRLSKVASLALALVAAGTAASARADVQWQWQMYNGASTTVEEAGTIITDGTMADLATSHTFTILSFHVTQSNNAPSNVGANYVLGTQLPETIVWNGSAITQFTRSGFTNGSNFYRSDGAYFYTLDVGFGQLMDSGANSVFATGNLSVTAQGNYVPSAAPVPTLGLLSTILLSLLVMAAGMFGFRRRFSQGNGGVSPD